MGALASIGLVASLVSQAPVVEGPADARVDEDPRVTELRRWKVRERRLVAGVTISALGMAAGLGLVIGGLVRDLGYGTDNAVGLAYFVPIGGAAVLLCAIPTGGFGDELARHRRARPGRVALRLGAGSLRLDF